MKTRFVLFAIVVVAFSMSAAFGQTQQAPPPAWGTSSDIAVRVPAEAFIPYGNADGNGVALWGTDGGGQRWRISQTVGGSTLVTSQWFDAPLDLPSGAKITGLRGDYCNTRLLSDVLVLLQVNDEPMGTNQTQYPVFSNSNSGCASMFIDLTANNIVIDHQTKSYRVRFGLTAQDSTNKLRGAVVFYRLQISPDPATATFTDVPVGHPFHRFVEALVAAGITGGCGGGNYCPDAPVTRGQMAVFLSAALGLHWAP